MPKCRLCDEFVPVTADRCPNCGVPVSQPSADLEQQVRLLMDRGRIIEAIKLYRKQTGVGLAEGKEAVEAIQAGASPPSLSEMGGDVEAELLRLLGKGQKIQAIKLYREHTGMGLAEAKRAVEALTARHGLSAQRAGCLGVLVGIVVAAVAIGMMIR
jgi:large subunit ribosomal protein L7/L12